LHLILDKLPINNNNNNNNNKHEIKEVQKTSTLVTAHTLRKVLMQTYKNVT